MSNALNTVLDNFSSLSLEDKEYASEQIKKIIIEARREEIYNSGLEAEQNYKDGKSKIGSVSDLFRDIND